MTGLRFEETFTFEERQKESRKVLGSYEDRVPVIVQKVSKHSGPEISNQKYLVPRDLSVGKFLYVIRKRLKLNPEKALFIYVKKELPPTSELMGKVYDTQKDDDGFLYLNYALENTFG